MTLRAAFVVAPAIAALSCSPFSAVEDVADASPPDAGGGATECGNQIFFDDFNAQPLDPSWKPDVGGPNGSVSANGGTFVATAGTAGKALVDRVVPLPTGTTVACMTLRLRVDADASAFKNDGYTSIVQTDLTAAGQSGNGYLGLNVDARGISSNITGVGSPGTELEFAL